MLSKLLVELEEVFVKKRLEVVDKNGFLITPLHIVKKKAEEFNERIHSELYIFNQGHHGDLQRVELFIGLTRGLGQAPTKGLAFQLAALDILEKIKFFNEDEVFPVYGIPPGALINPKVLGHLMALCRRNCLEVPKIEIKNSGRPLEERELFDCVVQVGQLVTEARSDNRYMARRIAVHDMYNKISTEPYPGMPLAFGKECVGLARLRELGIHPLMSSAKRDWLQQHRTTGDNKLMRFDDLEPDDGDFLDPDDVV